MKILCTLKVNKHSTAKLELDLKGQFNKSTLEHELRKHEWFYKNKDRLKFEPR